MRILSLLIVFLIYDPINIRAVTDRQVLNDGFIKIQYDEADIRVSELLLSIIKIHFESVANTIGYFGPPIANVIISHDQNEFNDFTGNILPEWSQGSTDYGRSLIVVKSPLYTGDSEDEFKRTVIHELTHFLIGAASNPYEVPRWFNEGLAGYLSSDESFRSKIIISKAVLNKTLITLNDVRYVLTFDDSRANLAYAESRAAIELLINSIGEDKIQIILSKLNLNKSFDSAFTEVTGMDHLDFEVKFRIDVKRRYKYYFLAAADDYIWYLIPVLFILAYFGVKLKNRKTIKRWEAENGDGEEYSE